MKLIPIILILILTGEARAESPRLGTPISNDVTLRQIMPDGKNLPPGQGTAKKGVPIYQQKCMSCHGVEGRGGSADALAGATQKLTDEWPEKTIGTYWPYATTVFDMIRRSMPMATPGSLADDEVYALTAYLLYLNGIIGETDIVNQKTLPAVEMPNRNGFILTPLAEEHKRAD